MPVKFVERYGSYAPTNGYPVDKLPGQFFNLQASNEGFQLGPMKPPEVPEKIYGEISGLHDRIVNTFKHRAVSTGVLLVGEKGSGKTMLVKRIAKTLVAEGTPVIAVNSHFMAPGEVVAFLSRIDQDHVLIFDEFDKTFGEAAQAPLLTMLDGLYSHKRLLLFTCNNKYAVRDEMINRPGRLFYHLRFTGMDDAAIIEYCNENLLPANRKFADEIMQATSAFHDFNFDMLKCLVEEINRYGEGPYKCLPYLNIRPTNFVATKFRGLLTYDKDDKKTPIELPTIDFNPASVSSFEITFKEPTGDEKTICLKHSDLANFEKNKIYKFEPDDFSVVFKVVEDPKFKWAMDR